MGGIKQSKKKPKKSQHAKQKHDRNQEEEDADSKSQQEDEWTAISAIFQDDAKLLRESPHLEYSISLAPLGVPFGEGRDAESDILLEMVVRYTAGYPRRPPKLQLISKSGVQAHERSQLLELLNDQAAVAAREGRVAVYNLAETAQEFLTQLLPPETPKQDAAHSLREGAMATTEEREEGGDSEGPAAGGWNDCVNVALFGGYYADEIPAAPDFQAAKLAKGSGGVEGKGGLQSPARPGHDRERGGQEAQGGAKKRASKKAPDTHKLGDTAEGAHAALDPPLGGAGRGGGTKGSPIGRALQREDRQGSSSSSSQGPLSPLKQAEPKAVAAPGPSRGPKDSPLKSPALTRKSLDFAPLEGRRHSMEAAGHEGRGGLGQRKGKGARETGEDRESSDEEEEEDGSDEAFGASGTEGGGGRPQSLAKVIASKAWSGLFQQSEDDASSTADESSMADDTGDTVSSLSQRDFDLESGGGEGEGEDGGSQPGEDEEDEEDEEEDEEGSSGKSRPGGVGLLSGRGGGGHGDGVPDVLKRDKVERMVQRDLLLGHMLQLLASPGGRVPSDSLPLLTQQLAHMRLLPQWLADLLLHKPESVNKALLKAVPTAVLPPGQGGEEDGVTVGAPDVAQLEALKRFWSTGPSKASEESESAAAASRYLSDFVEEAVLGKGGFGQVILCINKLDGRKYAVKRIPLKDQSAVLNSKILREVATLSRLQHHNVVRYYQAWFETGVGRFVGMLDAASEDVETTTQSWLTGDITGEAQPGFLLEHLEGREESEDSLQARVLSGQGQAGRGDGGGQGQRRKEALTFLYIQMEFCPRTLRQVLDSRSPSAHLDKELTWRVFRQIVEGLVHIHSQGVVHRDLNPNNIFFDARGDVKIGDFGLAKFTDAELVQGLGVPGEGPEGEGLAGEGMASAEHVFGLGLGGVSLSQGGSVLGGGGGVHALEAHGLSRLSLSGQVGTFFYTAPETEQGWAQTDEKVDIYSLGVVLLELWFPFDTGMERAVTLTSLKKRGEVPERLQKEVPQVAELILWLTSALPAHRPSAQGVLQSPLVPPRMEDESLNAILRSLESREDATVFDKVVSSLFAEHPKTSSSSAPATTGLGAPRSGGGMPRASAGLAPQISFVRGRARWVAHVKRIFEVHRAVETETPLFVDDSEQAYPFTPPSKQLPRALDSSGAVLSLRFELRQAFAQWLAQTQTPSVRRYEVSRVFRKASGRVPPHQFYQADLDLVGPATCPALAEAEVLKVAAEVVSVFPHWDPASLEVRLNHRDLLGALWEHCGVKRSESGAVAQLLAAHSAAAPGSSERRAVWPFIRRQLLQGFGLEEETVSKLQAVERRWSGPAGKNIPRLRGAFPDRLSQHRTQHKALDALAELLTLLHNWGLEEQTTLDPLMAPSEDYFGSIYFQVYARKREDAQALLPVTGHRAAAPNRVLQGMLPPVCIAVGGRYDRLIRSLWGAEGGTPLVYHKQGRGMPPGAPGGVGISLALHTLLSGADSLPSHEPGNPQAVPGPDWGKAGPAAEVLVCSRGGGGRVEQRMVAASLLWAAGVKAELLPMANPSLTEQYEYAQEHGLKWLVIVSDTGVTVKVRNIETRMEDDVDLPEVPKFLADASRFAGGGSTSHSLRRHQQRTV